MNTSRLEGQSVLVTGATSGIGFFIAEGLARLGAQIIVAARSAERAQTAIALFPEPGRHRHLELDLSDLASVRAAGSRVGTGQPVHGLVMNAGVIAAHPSYVEGPFGVESTVGVNVLAHLEFLRLSFPALMRAPAARVVSTGSFLTRKIPFDAEDWLTPGSYRPRVAYAASKHAAEILGFELDRRLIGGGSPVRSIVSHPGSAIDALTPDRPPLHQRPAVVRALATVMGPVFSKVAQGKDVAAQPAIAAMTAPVLPAEAYFGPRTGATGTPILASPVPTSLSPELGRHVWTQVEERLGASIIPEQ
ncbi:SDR family NAD(P)-dependent oxidoreductase [Pseudoclavibacter terrae]|uniref:SDR family NAD(P)-dependent oxidoreductase n=1 Tax=Pseudoclavibacter terrae TaxID=1530195 RepID=UPI0023313E8A|nr:SDR family NAD(P)-dependent oxidoreductase [Pseudoclavibacter terrae]